MRNPKKSRSYRFVCLVLGILFLCTGCGGKTTPGERTENNWSHHPSFVTRQELNAILAGDVGETVPVEGRVVSAVVPHHLVAGRQMAQVMAVLSRQKPARIIIVGPNHPNAGARIITGYAGWQTPDGITETDRPVVSLLLESGLAARNEAVLSGEHSIGALVPLIRHYLPEVKIVPIILHHDISLQEVDEVLKTLEPYLDADTVLISSVDFSHYLNRSEAQAKDLETIRYMQNYDYTTLLRLGNDYLDSPASLAVAFRLAEKNGIREFTVLANTNSGIIMQNDFIETTSYFTLVFTATK